MFAAALGFSEIVTLLLRAGADPTLEDVNGDTARDAAVVWSNITGGAASVGMHSGKPADGRKKGGGQGGKAGKQRRRKNHSADAVISSGRAAASASAGQPCCTAKRS